MCLPMTVVYDCFRVVADSPGLPASANAHELFRGFSFVAPGLLEDDMPKIIPETMCKVSLTIAQHA